MSAPTNAWARLVGPRIPTDVARYLLPTHLFAGASILLILSIFSPYWTMTLHAPQYPNGLQIRAYLTHLTGDVREIDELNHYIGMRPLGEAAVLERSLSVMAVGALAFLVAAATFIHSKWAAVLALPALLFPGGFLLDLHLWMKQFGTHLDPTAPLSSSIKPFVPPVLGEGFVGQFRTVAGPDIGLLLAAAASLVILVGLWAHRRAYKPLFDAMEEGGGALGAGEA